MENYDDISQIRFDDGLRSILADYTGEQLLSIPGIYEIVSEHFNNEVLAKITAQDQEKYDNT